MPAEIAAHLSAPGVGAGKGAHTATLLEALARHCAQKDYAAGEILRRRGEHYRDMVLIATGTVHVDLAAEGVADPIVVGPGMPIGEIGFLHGTPANATVTAGEPVTALLLDDATLSSIERVDSMLAAELMRSLARTAADRTSHNLTLTAKIAPGGMADALEVRICRNQDMLIEAQRLRYRVYCLELCRNSPYANHSDSIIRDPLDEFGHCFIALRQGAVIGTLRANYAREGELGALEEVYGMRGSRHHPAATGICTKFVVASSHRGGPAAMRLIAGQVQYGLRHGMKECYIDCVPTLVDYYSALGFSVSGNEFFHRENGPSVPMRLDLVEHGEALSGEAGARRMLKLYVKAMRQRAASQEPGAAPGEGE
ncbi:MAG: cyclic nucleotide-binding domain-containing protein [Rhizobiales bacterium]|nr:cyclic nucleotide-binding domain-containing protein [Hyphomicrobiales bacterium]